MTYQSIHVSFVMDRDLFPAEIEKWECDDVPPMNSMDLHGIRFSIYIKMQFFFCCGSLTILS
jgi:hypothetical protein